MATEANATDLKRIRADLEAAIDGLMANESNAVRADMFHEASRFQAAIPHLQEALVSVERAITAAAVGGPS